MTSTSTSFKCSSVSSAAGTVGPLTVVSPRVWYIDGVSCLGKTTFVHLANHEQRRRQKVRVAGLKLDYAERVATTPFFRYKAVDHITQILYTASFGQSVLHTIQTLQRAAPIEAAGCVEQVSAGLHSVKAEVNRPTNKNKGSNEDDARSTNDTNTLEAKAKAINHDNNDNNNDHPDGHDNDTSDNDVYGDNGGDDVDGGDDFVDVLFVDRSPISDIWYELLFKHYEDLEVYETTFRKIEQLDMFKRTPTIFIIPHEAHVAAIVEKMRERDNTLDHMTGEYVIQQISIFRAAANRFGDHPNVRVVQINADVDIFSDHYFHELHANIMNVIWDRKKQ